MYRAKKGRGYTKTLSPFLFLLEAPARVRLCAVFFDTFCKNVRFSAILHGKARRADQARVVAELGNRQKHGRILRSAVQQAVDLAA